MRVYQAVNKLNRNLKNQSFQSLLEGYSNIKNEKENIDIEKCNFQVRYFKQVVIHEKLIYYKSFLGLPYLTVIENCDQINFLTKKFYLSKILILDKNKSKIIFEFIELLTSFQLEKIKLEFNNNIITYELTRIDSKVAQGSFCCNDFEYLIELIKSKFEDWNFDQEQNVIVFKKSLISTNFIEINDLLVIEDNQLFSSVFIKYLEKNNIKSKFVSSFSEGLESLRESNFNAIITDYRIGYEVANNYIVKIREMKPEIPLFVLSSSTEANTKIECLSAGADLFIEKAEDPRVVIAYLEKVIQ